MEIFRSRLLRCISSRASEPRPVEQHQFYQLGQPGQGRTHSCHPASRGSTDWPHDDDNPCTGRTETNITVTYDLTEAYQKTLAELCAIDNLSAVEVGAALHRQLEAYNYVTYDANEELGLGGKLRKWWRLGLCRAGVLRWRVAVRSQDLVGRGWQAIRRVCLPGK